MFGRCQCDLIGWIGGTSPELHGLNLVKLLACILYRIGPSKRGIRLIGGFTAGVVSRSCQKLERPTSGVSHFCADLFRLARV